MRSRRLVAVLAPGALVIAAAACHRRSTPPAPQPLPSVPAPYPSAPLSAGVPDIAALVARVEPCVVNITAVHEVAVPSPESGWPFGEGFGLPPGEGGGGGGGDQILREAALGSGFLIDERGHVVTNAHVVDQAQVVQVRLADGRGYRARILARDDLMDVAVIELEHAPGDLPVASLGSSSALRPGDYVIAIGNPFGLGETVTAGIVSATARALGAGPYDDFLQVDAPINPGNSGGPLFDLRGQVVGIDTMVAAQAQGIGFAIPIDEVKRALPELIATGHVARARLGVTVQPMDETLAHALGLVSPRGALVAGVHPGGPAAQAGLEPGDVILAVDGKEVAHSVDLPRKLAEHAPGARVRLTVLRDGQTRDIEVTLGAVHPARGSEGSASKQAPAHPPGGGPAGWSPFGFTVGTAPGGGAVVESVAPGGPADGKLAPGDVIESLNHQRVANAADLASMLHAVRPGEPIVLRVRHEGQSRYVGLELHASDSTEPPEPREPRDGGP